MATTSANGARKVPLEVLSAWKRVSSLQVRNWPWNCFTIGGRCQCSKPESDDGLENGDGENVKKPARENLQRSRKDKNEDAHYELISDFSGGALLRKLKLEQRKVLEESSGGGSTSKELQRYV